MREQVPNFFVPIKVPDGSESAVNISYKIKFIDTAKFLSAPKLVS